ncbi:MAG: sulfotransferase [Pseudomonadota bacterium]
MHAANDYLIAAEDSAPIVIGGLGGSGTRLVAELLQDQGVEFGGQLNESLDNMWFSLLFVRRSIFLTPARQIRRLAWVFNNAMRHGQPIPPQLMGLVDRAARYDRGPALRKAALEDARDSLLAGEPGPCRGVLWGWKQPNTHVMVPLLARCYPSMKYIYVMRNGLDMAFGYNQNQLKYFWGDMLLDGDTEATPENALRYWIASYERICGDEELLGDRLYILDFDALCTDTVAELTKLYEFVGIEASRQTLEEQAAGVRLPDSMGRYKYQDCSQLSEHSVHYVAKLGFEVPD